MITVQYTGTNKKTFSFTSMGKVVSYYSKPGDYINIPDNHLPYLTGYGCFKVIGISKQPKIEDVIKTNPIINVFEKEKESPIEAQPIVITKTSEVKYETQPVVDTPEMFDEVKEEVVEEVKVTEKANVDYTSMKKADLKALCKKRKLDSSGNRDDLIAINVIYDKSN